MKTCYIFSAVEMKNNFPKPDKDDLIIAADAGYLNVQKAGLRPDVVIGDFDSSKKPNTDTPIETFPILKDDTDTMLATNALRFTAVSAASERIIQLQTFSR